MEYELNDQDRAEIIKNFIRRYGYLIIAGMLIISFSFGLYHYIQKKNATQNQNASSDYQAFLVQAKNGASAITLSASAQNIIQTYPDTAYASLSKLYLAKQAVSQNHLADAAQILRADLAQNKNNALTPIITLRLARVLIANGSFTDALNLLSHPPKGFESSYAFLRGNANLALKNKSAAQENYALALAQSETASPIHALAEAQLSLLGSTS